MVALISAETSAATNLSEVSRWLIECQGNPVRLDVDDVPALGQSSRLKLDLPITAPRAVLCAAWLLEDVEAGGLLLAGTLRFVAHPTGSGIRLTFSGRTATAMRSASIHRQADQAARQLLQVIAESIERQPVARPSLKAAAD